MVRILTNKMRNSHGRNWNMARNTEKREKKINVHSRTWNMSRKVRKPGK
jgi:hypothetical protein